MAMLKSKSGYITLTPGYTGPVIVSGLDFEPKIVFLMSNPDTADIVADIANGHWSFGAFTNLAQFCQVQNSRNGIIAQDTARALYTDRVVSVCDPPGVLTEDYAATGVSLNTDGFTINVYNAPPINYRIGWLALGGTSLEAKIGNFTTAGGGQAITGVGFEPECVFLFSIGSMGITTNTGPGSFAFAAGTYQADGGFPSYTRKVFDTNWPHDFIGASGTTHGGGVMSFDADGFTTGYFLNPSSIAMAYVALRGGPDILFASQNSVLPASPGTFDITGLGFRGRAGFFLSHGSPTSAFGNGADLSVGFAGEDYLGTIGRYMMMQRNTNGVSPTRTAHATHSQRLMRFTNSSGTIIEDIDIQQWLDDGVRLNVITANPTPSLFGYLVMGDNDIVPPPQPVLGENFGEYV